MGVFDKVNSAFGSSKVNLAEVLQYVLKEKCKSSVSVSAIQVRNTQVGTYFDIVSRKSTLTQEIRAGTVTFLTVRWHAFPCTRSLQVSVLSSG